MTAQARAGNIRFDAFITSALLVGFKRTGQDVGDVAARVDLLLAFRRQAAAKFVIEPASRTMIGRIDVSEE